MESQRASHTPHYTLQGPLANILQENLILHRNLLVHVIVLEDIADSLTNKGKKCLSDSDYGKLHDVRHG